MPESINRGTSQWETHWEPLRIKEGSLETLYHDVLSTIIRPGPDDNGVRPSLATVSDTGADEQELIVSVRSLLHPRSLGPYLFDLQMGKRWRIPLEVPIGLFHDTIADLRVSIQPIGCQAAAVVAAIPDGQPSSQSDKSSVDKNIYRVVTDLRAVVSVTMTPRLPSRSKPTFTHNHETNLFVVQAQTNSATVRLYEMPRVRRIPSGLSFMTKTHPDNRFTAIDGAIVISGDLSGTNISFGDNLISSRRIADILGRSLQRSTRIVLALRGGKPNDSLIVARELAKHLGHVTLATDAEPQLGKEGSIIAVRPATSRDGVTLGAWYAFKPEGGVPARIESSSADVAVRSQDPVSALP